ADKSAAKGVPPQRPPARPGIRTPFPASQALSLPLDVLQCQWYVGAMSHARVLLVSWRPSQQGVRQMSTPPAAQSARPAVVLLSGGLDSSTALALAVEQGFTPHAISFRYGQRHS